MSKHPIIANRTAFLVIGCLEAAWAPLVPYVKRAFSLDEASLGLLMLCTGVGFNNSTSSIKLAMCEIWRKTSSLFLRIFNGFFSIDDKPIG